MSKTGRFVIDSLKRRVGSFLKFPAPPADQPYYWDKVYRNLNHPFEWGDFTLDDMMDYPYTLRRCNNSASTWREELVCDLLKEEEEEEEKESKKKNNNNSEETKETNESTTIRSTTLSETIGLQPHTTIDQPILVLGCGNSAMGHQLAEQGYTGPVLNLDMAANLLQRLKRDNTNKNVLYVQDDAEYLSSLQDQTVHAVIDKGLMDSYFCNDAQLYYMVKNCHRVLHPDGVLIVLSYSRPDFFLHHLLLPPHDTTTNTNPRHAKHLVQKQWSSLQVRELSSLYLYRLVKARPRTPTLARKKRSRPKRRS